MKHMGLRLINRFPEYIGCMAMTAMFLAGCSLRTAHETKPVPGSEMLISKGNIAFSRLDYQSAWENYRKAHALGVRNGVVFYRLSVLEDLLRKNSQGKPEALRTDARRLLEEEYERGNSRPLAVFYLAQLREASGSGSEGKLRLYTETIRKFESQKFGPLSSEDYEKLARMYLFMGLAEQAEKNFLKAQELEHDNALARFYLGKLYSQTSREKLALAQFESFLKLVPKDTEGHILRGESAYRLGDYELAKNAFQTAYSLDPINSDARAGLQRTERILTRRDRLRGQAGELQWEVGLRSAIRPLTLLDDELELDNTALGAPFVGSEGRLGFTSGERDRYQIFTLSKDGLHLKRRAASSSAYSGYLGTPDLFLIALGVGEGREIGAYDDANGTFKKIHQGHCKYPSYSVDARKVVCLTPGGLVLVDALSENVSTLFREPEARHPRFSRDGKRVVLALSDEVVLVEQSGKLVMRHRLPGGRDSASYPDISPDGRWVISGSKGIYLTSLRDRVTLALDHPRLRNGRRPVFDEKGNSIVFEQGGRLFHLDFPRPVGSFFTLQQANAMIHQKRFGAAIRLLNERKTENEKLPGYHLLLAQAYLSLRFNEKAEMTGRQSARLAPQDWRPQLLLGRILALRGELDEASGYLDRAIKLGPDRFESYVERAKIRSRQGKAEAAIQDYRTALSKLGPNSGFQGESSVLGLLTMYAEAEQVDDALLLLLDHASRLSPNALDQIRTDSRFQIVRDDPRFGEVIGPPRPIPAREEPARPGGMAPAPDKFPTSPDQLFPPKEDNIRTGGSRSHPVERKALPVRKTDSKIKMKEPWVFSGVFFGFDMSKIQRRFRTVLDKAVAMLKANPKMHIEIQGHTDSRGNLRYNERLSEERANAVLNYFVAKGVRRERLTAKGYGETMPVASNKDSAGRAENRRVVLMEIENKEEVFAAK